MDSVADLLEFSLIPIDKPSGPTSVQVSDYVREQLGLRKTSHMGTLDPGVSGVLPITLNRACKLSPYFMKKEKSYVGIMRLHEQVSRETLENAIKKFTGTIIQKPPVRSNVRRVERPRSVFSFTLLEQSGLDVVFETRVEAGTYIRTLVHDLGKEIGGAHMLELRRTQAGLFEEKKAYTLYDFDKAVAAWKSGDDALLKGMLIPADEALQQIMPTIQIKPARLAQIKTGKPIHAQDLAQPLSDQNTGSVVAVFCKTVFIEVARLVLEGDVIAKPEFVLN